MTRAWPIYLEGVTSQGLVEVVLIGGVVIRSDVEFAIGIIWWVGAVVSVTMSLEGIATGMTTRKKIIWKNFHWSHHQFLFMEKIGTTFYSWGKTGRLKNEIGFGILIIHRKRWKLNPTVPLWHPSFDGYLELVVQIK